MLCGRCVGVVRAFHVYTIVMSYSDWCVDREEMRPCKRAKKVDAPERHLYVIIPCKHCDHEIEIKSDSLRKHKKQSIDAHLGWCPNFQGVRPRRRWCKTIRKQGDVTPLVPHVTPSRDHQQTELKTLKEEMQTITQENQAMKSELDATLHVMSQHQMWWNHVAMALGYTRVQDPSSLVLKIKELRVRCEADPHGTMAEYQKNIEAMLEYNAKTLEHRDQTIREKTRLLEQKDALLEAYRSQAEENVPQYRDLLQDKTV